MDETDREVGHMSKAACHDGDGVLHRAFSLFIFNRSGELLLQQRSSEKRLWPLYWSNSCCSHPRRGEAMDVATHRRLSQELGMTSDLEFLFKFQYQVPFKDLGSENELCSVFVGISDDPVLPNVNEIADHRWIPADQLNEEMTSQPDTFTPWFRMEWHEVSGLYREALGL